MKHTTLAIVLVTVLSLALVFETGKAQLSTESTIIRIRSDGTVEGTDKIQRNGNIYILTDDIHGNVGSGEAFIFVEKDNIVIDGAGHTLQGAEHGTAIYMLRRQSVTVKNLNIKDFETGINFWTVQNWPADAKFWGLPPASDNQILDNNITVTGTVFGMTTSMEAGWAIYLQEAYGTLISGNTITSQDPKGGIYFGFVTRQTSLQNNKFVTCGLHMTSSDQNAAFGNMVDGKPLVFLAGQSNQVVGDAGLVYLFNCENITVKNIEQTIDYGKTIQLTETTNTKVTNCQGYITLVNSNRNFVYANYPKTVQLSGSSYNKISSNVIVTTGVCISLYGSSNYNEVNENILLNDNDPEEAAALAYSGKNIVGISLGDGCQYNDIYGNNIVNQSVGFECFSSSLNRFYSNSIVNSSVGVSFSSSGQNSVFQNSIEDCGYAGNIIGSENIFYHNNFADNEHRFSVSHQMLFSSDIIWAYSVNNTFDAGYPSGGNFWSDYTGADANGDGIGDVPYAVCENHTDHYPLMAPVVLEFTPPVIDDASPSILIISPERKTYKSTDISLMIILSKKASWIGYSLDGFDNVTIKENVTLTGLSSGSHNITVYAKDFFENTGTSETIFFTTAEEPEPFSTTLIIVSTIAVAAVVCLGFLVYPKKRRREATQK